MNNMFSAVWSTIYEAMQSELSNTNWNEFVVVVFRLGLAALLGGFLGYEREQQGKSAGIRTHILVALGSALLMLSPLLFGITDTDTARVIQGVVTGIGFLGAGTIVKMNGIDIHGLTTAAGIWVTSAIGLSVGLGQWMPAVVTTLFMMLILTFFKNLGTNGHGLTEGHTSPTDPNSSGQPPKPVE